MNDPQIIAAIQRRDENAIRWVMRKYARLLWGVCATILKNVGAAEDIEECVADAFIHLWENPGQFDPAQGSLKTWLAIVARSRATDRYRQLARRLTAPLDDRLPAQADLAAELLSYEDKQALLRAVRRLPQPGQEILARRYFYGQKPKEIAFALQIPVKQVQNHLYQSKLHLRKILTKEGENG